MENKDKPAYPDPARGAEHSYGNQSPLSLENGLTKREMFAIAAMQGMSVNYFNSNLSKESESIGANIDITIAIAAVSLADELLKQLES